MLSVDILRLERVRAHVENRCQSAAGRERLDQDIVNYVVDDVSCAFVVELIGTCKYLCN